MRRPTFGSWKPAKPAKVQAPPKPKNEWQAASNRSLAIEAGQKRLQLAVEYDGERRLVEVQVVGTTKKDRPAMRVYQVQPQSDAAPERNFRLLCFDECFGVALTDKQAAPPRSNKNNRDEGFDRIDWAYV